MQSPTNPVTLFFDYDGTLHESLRIYAPAFRLAYAALVEQKLAPAHSFTDIEIGHWLGCTAQEMWTTFLPQLQENQWRSASRMVGEEMLRQIHLGNARLYPHALETLAQLKAAKFQLVFLSNCSHPYMEAHKQQFPLDDYFSTFYCIADHPASSKAQLYQQIRQYHPGPHIMIGDRRYDLQVAQQFDLPFIGCRYGYSLPGELDSASICIDDITQLLEAILKNLKSI